MTNDSVNPENQNDPNPSPASETEQPNSASEEAAAQSSDDSSGQEGEDGAPVAPDENKNPRLKWYVAHTYSMFEEKARRALEEQIKAAGADEKFGEIVVPKTSHETVLKSGKKKRVEKNAFPGYILIEMEMDEQTNHLVRGTPKITGFVGNARNPRPISDQEVMRLTAPETVEEEVEEPQPTQTFEKGESVKVIDGAFTNFDGVVDAVHADKMKLRILVSIFGRETPVELDYNQVEKLS